MLDVQGRQALGNSREEHDTEHSRRTVVALVLVLHRLCMPVVALGVLGLAVVALVLVHRLGVVLRRLGVAVVALVLMRGLRVVLGLACACMRQSVMVINSFML